MAETADSVIVAIEARTGAFTPAVQQGATAFDASMRNIENAATRMERQVGHSFNNTRVSQQILMHVARASADQFAAGAPPMMIFTQHLAQLAEAGAYAGGSLGRFGTFLSGPWGIAVTFAITILGSLIAKHGEGSEAAHRHETAEETLARALNGEADALQKVLEAQRAQNREAAESVRNATQRAAAARVEAQANLDNANAIRRTRLEQLAQARDELLARQQAGRGPGQRGEISSLPGAGLPEQQRIAELTAQIDTLNAQVAADQLAVRNREIEFDRSASTHVGRTNIEFDVREGRLQEQRQRGQITQQQLIRGENELSNARARAVEAAQRLDDAEQGRTHRGPGEDVVDRAALLATARQHLGQTEGGNTATLQSFFRSAGININPQQMAWCAAFVAAVLASNGLPVARGPDGNPALGARGYLNYGTATTHPEAGDIVVLRDQNRRRNSPEHGHTGFFEGFTADGRVRVLGGNQGRGGAVSEATFSRSEVLAYRRAPTAAEGQTQEERAARQAQEMADRRARDEERFQNELAGLNVDLVNARRQQVQTAAEAAAFEIQQIEAERDRKNAQFHAEEADRTRRDAVNAATYHAEAEQAIALNNQVAATRANTVREREQQRLDEQRLTLAISELNSAESIERARGSLARTIVERRDSELRLLDYAHQEELLAIEKLRAARNLTPEQRADLDRREMTANAIYPLARQSIMRQNQMPLEQFFDRIPRTAQEMDEALQGVAANGLEQLNTGLGEAAARFLHLGGVAGNVLNAIINDMIQLILRQAELAAFGGGGGVGAGGIFGSIGRLFGGGGGASAYTGELLPGSSAILPGFALGGAQMVGGYGGADNNVVSVNGRPRFRASGDEVLAVIPQGKGLALSGGGARTAPQITYVTQELHLDLTNAVLTPQLVAQMNALADQAAARGAQDGVHVAEQRAYRRARQAL